MQLFENLAYCEENSYCYIYWTFSIFRSWYTSGDSGLLQNTDWRPNGPEFRFRAGESGPHSVKFSWLLSEFIVSKVEIEDRNLVLALLRKIPGSAGKNIDFRFNYTPECMASKYAFLENFWGGAHPAPHHTSPPLNLGLRLWFGLRSQFSGASRPRFTLNSPSIHPSNMFINPFPPEGD